MSLNSSMWTPSTVIDHEDDILDNDEAMMDDDDEEFLEDESTYTSSPSIPDENIDFDLVYTLHSFEATVDGQASVQKGNALTLLDDSNSYWWLIRDLKTSEVGYIPAENIETPFERLARLNKHRNVQLTSSEHAPFYTTDVTPSYIRNRRVTMSTSLFVQAQILLMDENEEVEDEAYETWNEQMNDDDDENVNETRDLQHQQYMDDILSGIGVIGGGGGEGGSLKATNKKPASSFIEDEKEGQIPSNSKVLRVFAGNINVGASYHSVRVVESTSVLEMLSQAMEKFRLSEIETQQGYSMRNSCVEYYLAIKSRDGHEITLDPKDKPLAIFESLTSHLTTPMPSLTNIKQLSKKPTQKQDQERSVKNKKKKKQLKKEQQEDINTFHFYIHKRIKHVNDTNGQVHVKVSLLTQPVKGGKVRKMSQFRLSKKKKPKHTERIDKLIAIPASITIADLTNTALEKFHIISNIDQSHHYRILLQADGKETLLNPSQLLNQVLKNVGDREYCFLLKNFSAQIEERPISLSSSSSSSSYNRPTSIMTRIDSSTENAFKRIDTVVETFEDPVNHSQKSSTNYSPYSTALSDEDKSGLGDRYPFLDNNNVSQSLLQSHTKDSNLSSLDDLEKELQRILTSHTS